MRTTDTHTPMPWDMCSIEMGWACGALRHGGAISLTQEDKRSLPKEVDGQGAERSSGLVSGVRGEMRLDRLPWMGYTGSLTLTHRFNKYYEQPLGRSFAGS